MILFIREFEIIFPPEKLRRIRKIYTLDQTDERTLVIYKTSTYKPVLKIVLPIFNKGKAIYPGKIYCGKKVYLFTKITEISMLLNDKFWGEYISWNGNVSYFQQD